VVVLCDLSGRVTHRCSIVDMIATTHNETLTRCAVRALLTNAALWRRCDAITQVCVTHARVMT
jgi:hypothetical protein